MHGQEIGRVVRSRGSGASSFSTRSAIFAARTLRIAPVQSRRAPGVPAGPAPVRRSFLHADTGIAGRPAGSRSDRQSLRCGAARRDSGGRAAPSLPPISRRRSPLARRRAPMASMVMPSRRQVSTSATGRRAARCISTSPSATRGRFGHLRDARQPVEPLLVAAVIARGGAEIALAGKGPADPGKVGLRGLAAAGLHQVGRQGDQDHALAPVDRDRPGSGEHSPFFARRLPSDRSRVSRDQAARSVGRPIQFDRAVGQHQPRAGDQPGQRVGRAVRVPRFRR